MHNLSAFEIEEQGVTSRAAAFQFGPFRGSPLSLQLSRPFSISILPSLP